MKSFDLLPPVFETHSLLFYFECDISCACALHILLRDPCPAIVRWVLPAALKRCCLVISFSSFIHFMCVLLSFAATLSLSTVLSDICFPSDFECDVSYACVLLLLLHDPCSRLLSADFFRFIETVMSFSSYTLCCVLLH